MGQILSGLWAVSSRGPNPVLQFAAGALTQLHHFLHAARPIPFPSPPEFRGRAPIVIGYSNALFTLGCRYERSPGHSHNLREALRCYQKSARLGNPAAQRRLGHADFPPT